MKDAIFDSGHHRRMWPTGKGEPSVQQYWPQPTFDPTSTSAIERIREERRSCSILVSDLHVYKKECASQRDFEGARILGKLAKEYEGWVKAATWLLGWMGEGLYVHPKDWGHELWPQLDGLINMAGADR